MLVVTSKIKKLVKDHAQMNTSAEVIDSLTTHIKFVVLNAIESAKNDGRKTVMGRDIVAVVGNKDV